MTSSGFQLEVRRTEQYRVFDAIAVGGMASVHIGLLEGAFGFTRIVAIKRLHPHLASDDRLVTMLIDEARLVSRIRHINVAPTLDILHAGGEVLVVLEYVRGASLARLIADTGLKSIPAGYVQPILVGALRGLQAAHEAVDLDGNPLGIVHRDVSPQNILVGVGGIPRVIDFGVARAVGNVDVSRKGEFKGKLAYAAPEQLTDGEANARTDVYAAGVVLWELLAGRRLHKGATDLETYRNILSANVADPLANQEHELPRVSGPRLQLEALAAAAMRALDRDPARRFSTAAAMADALDAAGESAPGPVVGAWVQSTAAAQLDLERNVIMRAEKEHAATRRRSLSLAIVGDEPTRPEPRPSRIQDAVGPDQAQQPSAATESCGPPQPFARLRWTAWLLVTVGAAIGAAAGSLAASYLR